jgi:IS30 family transposase
MKKAHLIPEQRYTISSMNRQGCTQKQIAEAIGKDKSVVSRELKRNANSKGKYSFEYAQDMANLRKERMKKPRKLHSWLKKEIVGFIQQDWSPQQIEGRLKLENRPFVSHETIYKIIRKDKIEGGTLYRHTRHKLKHRKRPVGKKIAIKNRVTIDQRPEIVNTKQRFGDWEIDTIVGENNRGAIVTMVERQTAFMLMGKMPKNSQRS